MTKRVVLVVEDEALIRLAAVLMVEGAGYVALEAANADDALAILDARNDVDIVFTDINMPGSMDGLKMVRAIHRRWPPIRLIVTSGKTGLEGNEMPAGHFLSKPYGERQLTDALKAA